MGYMVNSKQTNKLGQQPFCCRHYPLPRKSQAKKARSISILGKSYVLNRGSFAYVISLGIVTTMATFDMSLSYDRYKHR